ncbi:MAG: hypothetical protein K5872_16735 [Rhizobiaceae bacterium]|nr:hypothetical protein [Rhizobiaceae bacterium]MCV0407870.1 hypothetical protein [Rhizobiaceae bacterium]
MDHRLIFFAISAFWGMAMILNLLTATRICHAIEHRSGRTGGAPGLSRLIPVAMNRDVAQDAETQELRSQMNKRLLIVVIGVIAYGIFLQVWPAAEG